MFRKDLIGRRGGGVILYVKESIQAYEIKLEREAVFADELSAAVDSGMGTMTNIFGSKHCLN